MTLRTKEETKQLAKKKFGDRFIKDFISYFCTFSIDNTLYAKILLHVILGQAMWNGEEFSVYYRVGSRKIDPRVHLLLIKPQATGKGAGFNVATEMCKRLNLVFEQITSSTGAGLVGTKYYNAKKRQEEVEYGPLKYADMIGMEEASVIFDLASDWSKKNMVYMQVGMNNYYDSSSEIDRKLGTKKISYKPHASFILTSYPPAMLAEKMTQTGFLDRMICIFQNITLEERLDIIRQIISSINQDKDELLALEKSVGDRFETIVNFWKKGDTEIKIPAGIHETLLDIVEDFAIKILDASPKAREKLEHFISRLSEILLKLAVHHALMNLRERLDISDILYARMTFLPIWRNLIISIESLLIIDPEERSRYHKIIFESLREYDRQIKSGKYVRDKVWVRRLSMLPELQQKWDNCSKETADNNLQKLEKKEVLVLDTKKFSRISKLEQKDKFFETKEIGESKYIRKIREIKK